MNPNETTPSPRKDQRYDEVFQRSTRSCVIFPRAQSRGRVAMLTFHSGEDRRVKKSFDAGTVPRIVVMVSGLWQPRQERHGEDVAPTELSILGLVIYKDVAPDGAGKIIYRCWPVALK